MKTISRLASATAAVTALTLTGCVYETRSYPYVTETVETQHRPGYVIQTLPSRHQVEVISGTRYYHHDGVYYRPHSSGYVVVDPPHRTVTRSGTIVRTLPPGYRSIVHGGTRYYVHGSTYYRPHGSSYLVVQSPF
jgi:hypothetical protein